VTSYWVRKIYEPAFIAYAQFVRRLLLIEKAVLEQTQRPELFDTYLQAAEEALNGLDANLKDPSALEKPLKFAVAQVLRKPAWSGKGLNPALLEQILEHLDTGRLAEGFNSKDANTFDNAKQQVEDALAITATARTDGRERIERARLHIASGSDRESAPGADEAERLLIDPGSPLIRTEAQGDRVNSALVEALKRKVHIVIGNKAKVIEARKSPEALMQKAQKDLDAMFAGLINKELSPMEQDLFNYYVTGDGRDIPIEFRPDETSGAGYYSADHPGNDRGIPFVKFGYRRWAKGDHLDSRNLAQLMKHEMSHTMDSLRLIAGQSPEIQGYNGYDQSTYDQHVSAFREFRANLWAFDGKVSTAYNVTFLTYTAMKKMVDLMPRGYPPERVYRVLLLLSRNVHEQIFENEEGLRTIAQNVEKVEKAYAHPLANVPAVPSALGAQAPRGQMGWLKSWRDQGGWKARLADGAETAILVGLWTAWLAGTLALVFFFGQHHPALFFGLGAGTGIAVIPSIMAWLHSLKDKQGNPAMVEVIGADGHPELVPFSKDHFFPLCFAFAGFSLPLLAAIGLGIIGLPAGLLVTSILALTALSHTLHIYGWNQGVVHWWNGVPKATIQPSDSAPGVGDEEIRRRAIDDRAQMIRAIRAAKESLGQSVFDDDLDKLALADLSKLSDSQRKVFILAYAMARLLGYYSLKDLVMRSQGRGAVTPDAASQADYPSYLDMIYDALVHLGQMERQLPGTPSQDVSQDVLRLKAIYKLGKNGYVSAFSKLLGHSDAWFDHQDPSLGRPMPNPAWTPEMADQNIVTYVPPYHQRNPIPGEWLSPYKQAPIQVGAGTRQAVFSLTSAVWIFYQDNAVKVWQVKSNIYYQRYEVSARTIAAKDSVPQLIAAGDDDFVRLTIAPVKDSLITTGLSLDILEFYSDPKVRVSSSLNSHTPVISMALMKDHPTLMPQLFAGQTENLPLAAAQPRPSGDRLAQTTGHFTFQALQAARAAFKRIREVEPDAATFQAIQLQATREGRDPVQVAREVAVKQFAEQYATSSSKRPLEQVLMTLQNAGHEIPAELRAIKVPVNLSDSGALRLLENMTSASPSPSGANWLARLPGWMAPLSTLWGVALAWRVETVELLKRGLPYIQNTFGLTQLQTALVVGVVIFLGYHLFQLLWTKNDKQPWHERTNAFTVPVALMTILTTVLAFALADPHFAGTSLANNLIYLLGTIHFVINLALHKNDILLAKQQFVQNAALAALGDRTSIEAVDASILPAQLTGDTRTTRWNLFHPIKTAPEFLQQA
jgi:hypothetical protein